MKYQAGQKVVLIKDKKIVVIERIVDDKFHMLESAAFGIPMFIDDSNIDDVETQRLVDSDGIINRLEKLEKEVQDIKSIIKHLVDTRYEI